jgi:hypothetical protein
MWGVTKIQFKSDLLICFLRRLRFFLLEQDARGRAHVYQHAQNVRFVHALREHVLHLLQIAVVGLNVLEIPTASLDYSRSL